MGPFLTCYVDRFSDVVPVRLKVWGEEVTVLNLCDLWCYNVKNVELVRLSALVRAFGRVKENELYRLFGHVVNG